MMMRRPVRVGRPGLIGTAARTAVVAGTATAVSGKVSRKQQQKAEEKQQEEVQIQQPPAAPPPVSPPPAAPTPAAAPASEDMISQLERLAALKSQGILTDEEFAAQKARILGS